jgi:exodeoxyribonuclease VII large subunit
MHCLASNEHRYKFKVDEYNVLVQGYGAQAALTGALSRIQTKGGYDAVVVIRGGGAPADFLPFDDYSLALQVATFPIPIITGIGHHTNQGLCDFFASVHTKTPSMAAQYILDRNTSFEKRIQQLSGMLRELSGRVLRHQREQIEEVQRELKDGLREMIFSRNVKINAIQSAITGNVSVMVNRQASLLQTKQINLSHKSRILLSTFERQLSARTASLAFLPLQQIRMEKQKSAGLKEQLLGRTPQLLTARRKELEFYKENIRNLSPQRILERGFAMIKKDGRILSSASDIKPGDHLEIIHGDAVLQTEVEKKSKYNGREFNV